MKVALGLLAALVSVATAACVKEPAAPASGAVASSAGRETAAPAPVPSASQAPPPASPPRTAEECRRCRGEWKTHGIADQESCVCRTTDGGKKCRDGADCQGRCIAAPDDPEREVVEPGPPPRGYFVGRCSEVTPVFGCRRFIERGAGQSSGSLDEPPQMICAD